jgi:MFS family permease
MSTTRATRREWLGLAILALPTLLLSIDISVLFLALPQLSIDLGADSTQQLWILDIYSFMLAGFLVTMGTLGDRIGRRRLLLIGAAGFGITSVMAAYATSPEMLIAARALLGISGATLMPSTMALIRNMFRDPKQMAAAIGIWFSCFMGGMTLGPLVGGALLSTFWWGSAFLLGVPLMDRVKRPQIRLVIGGGRRTNGRVHFEAVYLDQNRRNRTEEPRRGATQGTRDLHLGQHGRDHLLPTSCLQPGQQRSGLVLPHDEFDDAATVQVDHQRSSSLIAINASETALFSTLAAGIWKGVRSVAGTTRPAATRSSSSPPITGTMRAMGLPLLVISTVSPCSTRASTLAVCWFSTRIGICSTSLGYYSCSTQRAEKGWPRMREASGASGLFWVSRDAS